MRKCLPGLSHESSARSGQDNFSGLTLKQEVTQNSLKILNLFAQSRCGEIKALGRPAEMKFFSNRNYVTEKSKLNVVISD